MGDVYPSNLRVCCTWGPRKNNHRRIKYCASKVDDIASEQSVFVCPRDEDDIEGELYIGNIVFARGLLLAVLGQLPSSPVSKALPGPPLANRHCTCCTQVLPGLSLVLRTLCRQEWSFIHHLAAWTTRSEVSAFARHIGPGTAAISVHPPIMYFQDANGPPTNLCPASLLLAGAPHGTFSSFSKFVVKRSSK
ncbi:uncharacterized protein LOC144139859 [Haemaphysalis longicornis]